MSEPVKSLSASDSRILDFASSEVFERTFREGMRLVEETAAYLDGDGRAESKLLGRNLALTYVGESMRLTTRLMQVASWLLVQRAVREGDMSIIEARDQKYRLAGRDVHDGTQLDGRNDLPVRLLDLCARSSLLYERVQRLDESMYGEAPAEPVPSPALAQIERLTRMFDSN